MTFPEYIRDVAPVECGVHPSFGKVAELVLLAEQNGEPAFHDAMFDTIFERAELLFPYPDKSGKRSHCLKVGATMIGNHRQKQHDDELAKELEQLATEEYSLAEAEMIERGWWNQ
jgi:uncharacterized protein with von Willebrand factor type A (vWA) domain